MREVQYCRQLRWHKKHLRPVTAKLTTAEYAMFKEICKEQGTTPYAVISRRARGYIKGAIRGAAENIADTVR